MRTTDQVYKCVYNQVRPQGCLRVYQQVRVQVMDQVADQVWYLRQEAK